MTHGGGGGERVKLTPRVTQGGGVGKGLNSRCQDVKLMHTLGYHRMEYEMNNWNSLIGLGLKSFYANENPWEKHFLPSAKDILSRSPSFSSIHSLTAQQCMLCVQVANLI